MREAVVEDVVGDGGEPDEVGAGLGADEEVGARGHLVLAQVGDDEPLAAKLVGALDAGGEHGMALGGVAADDEDEAGLLDVGDGAGIAAVADGAREAHGGRGLAVARAVVDVVGADDGARQLLHQVALFVGALGGGDEGRARRGRGSFLISVNLSAMRVRGFVPGGLAEGVAFADERGGEAVVGVDEVPGELALDAGGDAVGGAVARARF